jgi:hypothetical protein
MTAISEFYDPVRFILGDHDPACPDMEDAAIARGIKFIVRGGEVPGYAVAGDSITPDVTVARDYRLITLLTARAFRASEPDSKAMRVRPHAWTKGGYKTFLTMLDLAIAETRNGGAREQVLRLVEFPELVGRAKRGPEHLAAIDPVEAGDAADASDREHRRDESGASLLNAGMENGLWGSKN